MSTQEELSIQSGSDYNSVRAGQDDPNELESEDDLSANERQPRFDEEAEPSGAPTSAVTYFENADVDQRSSRRDSQMWNDMIRQASTQAAALRTPGRPGSQTQPEFRAQNKTVKNIIIIDGRPIPLAPKIRDANALNGRLYDKAKRASLSPESLQAFLKSATGYVLPKGNKLCAPSLVDAEGHLKAINNLGVQLRLIKRHLIEHDMYDVFTIVIPAGSVTDSPAVSELVSLFDAYPRLHADIIANSNTWYHLWSTATYLAENMNFSYEMLRRNTDDDLWLKCQEDYEEYAPVQRGGPLMLFLILRRIQDVSEAAIGHVKQSLKSLKITDIPGEDVDKVVSLIKSAHSLFKSASSACHSFVPEDFPKVILELFQTSSCAEFNSAFHREQQIAQHDADKTGQLVQWPTVGELTLMATNSYKRLQSTNQWPTSTSPSSSRRRRALAADSQKGSSGPRTYKVVCWNCGKDHTLKDCPHPKDQTKIDAARKAFNKSKRSNRRSDKNDSSRAQKPSAPRERCLIAGKPYIKNKKGDFVPDQKAMRAQREADPSHPTLAHENPSSTDSHPDTARSNTDTTSGPRVSYSTADRPSDDEDPPPTTTSTSTSSGPDIRSVLTRYTSRSTSR